MPFDMKKLEDQLALDEGKRFSPYKDTVGHLTVGIGHNLDASPLPHQEYPMTEAEVDALFQQDVARAVAALDVHLPWWKSLPDAPARALIDLAFSMGIGELMSFNTFLRFMEEGQYKNAATDLQGTLWYKQVGTRGPRVVALLRS